MSKEGIIKALIGVMSEVRAIEKKRKNAQQGYMFRGIDDIYNAIQPALINNNVVVVPTFSSISREERATKSGGTMIHTQVSGIFTFFHEGESIQATAYGEGMDSGDKSTNKAMSAAFKYALLQTLCIPTEEHIDSEADQPDTSGVFISSEQSAELMALIDSKKVDAAKFLAYMKVGKVDEILAKDFDRALSVLKKAKGAGNGNS